MANKKKADRVFWQKMKTKGLGEDEHRSPRYRRRKMQRMLEKNPVLLEELTKQMILNGSLPASYFKSPEAED
jgi:hypothetical protein